VDVDPEVEGVCTGDGPGRLTGVLDENVSRCRRYDRRAAGGIEARTGKRVAGDGRRRSARPQAGSEATGRTGEDVARDRGADRINRDQGVALLLATRV